MINLNAKPCAPSKCKSMYANPASSSRVGQGGPSNLCPALLHRSQQPKGNTWGRLGHGKALLGHISPLQRRNLNF
ncbi:unnamed protein product [Calypogeia fissa]